VNTGIPADLEEMLSFAWAMRHDLQFTSSWKRHFSTLNFSANVMISNVWVPCCFGIPSQWRNIPPTISCSEHWVRCEEDWHISSDQGELCWVLSNLWQDAIASWAETNPLEVVRESAVAWCIASSKELLKKHLEAHRHAYFGPWLPEWPQWPHGPEAAAQYEKMKHRGEFDRILTASVMPPPRKPKGK